MSGFRPVGHRSLAIGFSVFMVLSITVGFVPVGATAPTDSAHKSSMDLYTSTQPVNDSSDDSLKVSNGNETDGTTDYPHGVDADAVSDETTLRFTHALIAEVGSAPGSNSGAKSRTNKATKAIVKLQGGQQNSTSKLSTPTSASLPDTPTPDHPSPSGAVFSILTRHEVTLTAKQEANIRALDNLDKHIRIQLTDTLNAYLAYERAAMRLKQSKRSVKIVRAAQLKLVKETHELQTAIQSTNGPGAAKTETPGSTVSVQVAPVLSINLTRDDDTYTNNYALQIDRGGDDTYNNSAGGASGDAFPPTPAVAALVDLSGADTYNGKNGGADTFGAGFLLDAGAGDDSYVGGHEGTNGGGEGGGMGFLLDEGGDDSYKAGWFGTNGGSFVGGSGFLLDAAGDDTYEAGNRGTNGGGVAGGHGFLLDVAGDDAYEAGSVGTNGGVETVQLSGTVPLHAVGVLLDTGGLDYYNDSEVTCNDCSRLPKGTVGAQVDRNIIRSQP